MPKAQRIAIVAGGTGLVGSELLTLLVAAPEYSRVIALARRPLTQSHEKLQQREADFQKLDAVLADLVRASTPIDVFCCLGTTIRVAGSQAQFRRVDHDFVIALGRWCRDAGARRLLVISALGAEAQSHTFYSRVKGEMERDLVAMGLKSLVILRPSLLEGERREMRVGERLALLATRPLRRLIPARVRPVRARDVAAALLQAARAEKPPSVIESAQLQGASTA